MSESESQGKGRHILLVDDDPLLRRMFGGKLATAGYNIIYATNGPDGREVARRMKPDLILMDINMPGYENGMATANRLKTEEPTKNIPIIMLTNVDTSFDGEIKMKEIAADDYIHKSIELNDFIDRINNFLDSKNPKTSKPSTEKTKTTAAPQPESRLQKKTKKSTLKINANMKNNSKTK